MSRTLGHSDTRTLGHSDTRTLGHSDTRTLGHSDTRTLGHSILCNLLFKVKYWHTAFLFLSDICPGTDSDTDPDTGFHSPFY